MRVFMIIAILLYGCSNKLNNPPKQKDKCHRQYDFKLKKYVYDSVSEMPLYGSNQEELIKYLLKNIVYPDQETVQVTIKVALIIDADGSVKDEKIVDKDIDNYTPLDTEVLRIIRLMPKWEPGKCNKRKVPVRVFIPIRL